MHARLLLDDDELWIRALDWYAHVDEDELECESQKLMRVASLESGVSTIAALACLGLVALEERADEAVDAVFKEEEWPKWFVWKYYRNVASLRRCDNGEERAKWFDKDGVEQETGSMTMTLREYIAASECWKPIPASLAESMLSLAREAAK